MKKKTIVSGMVLTLMLGLTACVKSEQAPIDDLTIPITQESEGQSAEVNTQETENSKGMLQVYASVLEGIYADNVYPDGTECGLEFYSDVTDNRFAIYDIDQDGQEELIVQYSTACMAGMVETIYKYQAEGNTVAKELSQFPALHYYDNILIQADWSHNQGMAGEFWPYTLFQYDPESDTYKQIAMVDAWDKEYFPTDYKGNAFPDDIDTNKDGIVYYIMTDEYELENAVNTKDYNTWRDSYLIGAKELQPPYQNLTEENIKGITK